MTEQKKKHLTQALEKLTSSRIPATKNPAAEVLPQMALDLWPDAVRGVPNAVLRGALFSVSQRRTWVKNELLATVEGNEVRFTGQRFNQTDLDTWEMLVHLARMQPLGNRVTFTAHALLKALGRGTGQSQHQQLHDEIIRLRSGNVEITWTESGRDYGGGLVKEYYRDKKAGVYVVVLTKKMQEMYQNGYSQVDWGQRQALGNNNLSKWLHGFYSSHAKPYPYKVQTLKQLCGSTSKDLRDFRRMLKGALDDIVRVGLITSWDIDGRDLVSISKVPTLSQQKHLNKRSKPARVRRAVG